MGYERKRILLGLCKILNVIGIDIVKEDDYHDFSFFT